MAYIETALVSSSGKLLIQLDDGTVIDAGYVKGERGPAGRDGQDGAPGIPGARGEAGANGSRWFTGVGAPEVSEGADGDLYMDVASSMLPIYQKVSGDWLFLSNLKATPVGSGGGGAGGAAGGGGSVIIYPQPESGKQPDKDNDGKPISSGDLWYDPNTGLLWIYNGTKWLPIGDRPPVSVSPTPPLFNSSGDVNNPYPVRQGDLWFDSDQAALYVAAEDAAGDLVWVISTPADRSILQDEIPVGGFIFPAATQDGDTVFNDTTGLWYVYNGAKNQWIDLPPGERELSYPGILREADPAIDETYEGEADAADGDVYLNAPDHEAGTRLVIRKVDRKGFTWTDFIQGLTDGDGIALVQTNYDNGPDSPQTQRVDYLIVTGIVENIDSFNIEVDYEQQNFDHLPLFGEEVSVRFLAQVSSPAVCVDFQEDTPEPKCAGHLWFDTSDESLTLFVYTGDEWIPAAPPVSLDGINATIDAALIVQSDLLDRVESGEIVQASVLDSVSTLQHKVEALEGTVIDGKWYAESRSNPREGGFDLTTGGLQSMGDWEADFIRIHKTDTTGKVFTFAEVSTGDYIRIGAPGSTAVYKINDAPTGSLDWQAFGVELANSTGAPIPDLTYDFEFLPSFDPSTYATIQYVDAQDDLKLPLTGGEMSGRIDIEMADPGLAAIRTIGSINVKADNQEIGGGNNFIARKDYVRVFSTPSEPNDVVTKTYLDDNFAPQNHIHSDYTKAALWKAVSPSTAAGDLQVGEFFVADNNNIYLHFKSTNGIDLGVAGNESAHTIDFLASIYGRGTYNSVYSTVADKINFNVSSNKYIRVQSSYLLYKQAMNVGTDYVINIPGFTP